MSTGQSAYKLPFRVIYCMGLVFTLAAGYKDNMTDIRAALGIHHLKKQDRFIETWAGYVKIMMRHLRGAIQVLRRVNGHEETVTVELDILLRRMTSLWWRKGGGFA